MLNQVSHSEQDALWDPLIMVIAPPHPPPPKHDICKCRHKQTFADGAAAALNVLTLHRLHVYIKPRPERYKHNVTALGRVGGSDEAGL